METSLTQLIDRFANLKVVVIGEAMLDSYLTGPAERLCREAPVPIVDIAQRVDAPGGAANTAVNVRSLGADVMFVSVVGDDAEGQALRQALAARDVSTEYLITQAGRRTLAKHRVLAESHLIVRFDQGDKGPLTAETEQTLIDRLNQLFTICDAVIISDYDYGILSPKVIDALAALQAQTPQLISVDSKKIPAYQHVGITAVKPNFGEAVRLIGAPAPSDQARVDFIAEHGSRILDLAGAQIAAVTLDVEGALIFEVDRSPYRTYAQPAAAWGAAGAGDTVASALTLALAAGASTPSAAELASAAAAIVVEKQGTTACSMTELRERVAGGNKYLVDRSRLAARVELYRQQGKRLVFTNGCFDLLHRGHITYLNHAKALGDVLIVGLNTDESVRRLKGPSRPINSLEDRIQVLSALSSVDHIIAFEEDTPVNLIEIVRPDVYVKGGDYATATLPEADLVEALGGSVHILPYVDDHSTTSIIERIRRTYAWSPREQVPALKEMVPAKPISKNGRVRVADSRAANARDTNSRPDWTWHER